MDSDHRNTGVLYNSCGGKFFPEIKAYLTISGVSS